MIFESPIYKEQSLTREPHYSFWAVLAAFGLYVTLLYCVCGDTYIGFSCCGIREKKPLYITDRINTVEPRSKDTPDYLSNVNIT